MDGRAFFVSARLLMRKPSEVNRRSAISRGFFAVLNEARVALERWGFAVVTTTDIDEIVISHFDRVLNFEAIRVADVLTRLRNNRQIADYDLAGPGSFADVREVRHLLQLAQVGIDVLDQLEADPVQRAATVAAICAALP